MPRRAWLVAVFTSIQASAYSCDSLHNEHASLVRTHQFVLDGLEKMTRERDALIRLITFPEGSDEFETVLGNEDVSVRKSLVLQGGRGAFTRRIFEEGDIFGIYRCSHVLRLGADEHRSWFINETHSCDGHYFPLNNPILYVNSIAQVNTCKHQNARQELLPNGEIAYIATKQVGAGEEILVDYGHDFFLPKTIREPDLSIHYGCNMSPLRVACSRGDLEGIQRHLEGIHEIGTDQWSALMEASANGQHKAVELLLAKGGRNLNCNHADSTGQTALFLAAERGFTAVVKLLVQASCVHLSLARNDGAVPLFMAARNGHFEVAQLMAQSGVDVNEYLPGGATLLFMAAQLGSFEAFKIFIRIGADPAKRRLRDGMTPLFASIQNGHILIVRELLKLLDPKDQTINGFTPLTVAAMNGHLDVVKLLLRSGFDTNTAPENGATPFYAAAEYGHLEVVRVLKITGGVEGVSRSDGATALHVASENGHLAVVAFLLDHDDVDTECKMLSGATPLILAANNGHEAVTTLLMGAGAVVDAFLEDGTTALMLASEGGCLSVVGALLKAGANELRTRVDGATPLALASQNGHVEVAKVLHSLGGIKKVGKQRLEGNKGEHTNGHLNEPNRKRKRKRRRRRKRGG